MCGGGGYGRNEVNVLFNDGLNTFYLWLYDVIYMVKDHLNSKRVNPMPPHGPNIYGCPYWYSRNTFSTRNCCWGQIYMHVPIGIVEILFQLEIAAGAKYIWTSLLV